MKKLFLIAIIFAGVSCNSGSNSSSSKDSTTTTGPVENVNGNIPDTTNTTDITGKKKPDSTKIDSSKVDSASKKVRH